jgi:hypothetical protein
MRRPQARPPEPAPQQRHQRRHQESPDDQRVQQQSDPDGYADPPAVAEHQRDVVVVDLLSGALRAGASGFVLKDSSAEELIRAVRAVAHGDSYLDPAVTSRVVTTYRQVAGGHRSDNSVAE